MLVYGCHDLQRRVRPGDSEHLGVCGLDEIAAVLCAETAGDDHLAVLRERLADRRERLVDGGVDESAGVNDDQIGTLVGRRDRVAFGSKAREDLLRIDECLGTTEGDESDAWGNGVAMLH